MKPKYVLLSVEMARAYAEDRKGMTRRLVKDQTMFRTANGRAEWWTGFMGWQPVADLDNPPLTVLACPYGPTGRALVFLSTWATEARFDTVKPSALPRDARVWTVFDGPDKPAWCGRRRPGRFMPGWMRGRMPTETVKAVRVERVNDISKADAWAEGVRCENPVAGFMLLWERVNGAGAWARNDWTWVVIWKEGAK